jgi:hypothetical protein
MTNKKKKKIAANNNNGILILIYYCIDFYRFYFFLTRKIVIWFPQMRFILMGIRKIRLKWIFIYGFIYIIC